MIVDLSPYARIPLDRWRTLVEASRWRKHERGVSEDRTRCGVCWQEFTPGPNGPATFTEERGAILLRVCPVCEPRLTVVR